MGKHVLTLNNWQNDYVSLQDERDQKEIHISYRPADTDYFDMD